ncbi:MAG: restriction endonuclease [Candidatus Aenigmarchaeota archaeon]|nr:restriction endonuclease [Candidatus Aenigmarchaeota archaeon]
MVKTYKKGYTAEREIVHTLYKMGYAVIRTPRSGRICLPSPDIIAAKHGKIIVLECKSRKRAFNVPAEQVEELREWEKRAGATAYIAWKVAHKGWFFFPMSVVEENRGNIGKRMPQKAIGIDDI